MPNFQECTDKEVYFISESSYSCKQNSEQKNVKIKLSWQKTEKVPKVSNSAFEWSENYSIGHLVIDENHEYLFRLLDQAAGALDDSENPEFIQTILNQLLDYTQTHFRDEEALMISLAYPKLLHHQQAHSNLLDTVEDMMDEYRRGITTISNSLLLFLRRWVSKHIMEEDAMFATWLEQKRQHFES